MKGSHMQSLSSLSKKIGKTLRSKSSVCCDTDAVKFVLGQGFGMHNKLFSPIFWKGVNFSLILAILQSSTRLVMHRQCEIYEVEGVDSELSVKTSMACQAKKNIQGVSGKLCRTGAHVEYQFKGLLEFSKPGFKFGMKQKMQQSFLPYYDVYLSERDLQ